MKKLQKAKTTTKLNLNAETVQKLTSDQLGQIVGGMARNTQTCSGCIDTVVC